MTQKTLIAAAVGDCVHVAGLNNFMRLAEQVGWNTIYLGPAVSIQQLAKAARENPVDLIAVSYRLTPENGEILLGELAEELDDLYQKGVRFAFGGTPPMAVKAAQIGIFEKIFEGGEPPEIALDYLRGGTGQGLEKSIPPQSTVERILWKRPYPLIRHHFGLPDMEQTVEGVKRIADAGVIDVISLGIDQDAQENFFHPERQDPTSRGAGGVPVRSAEEYIRLYQAARTGNHPLMRTYSGTNDFIRLAEMYMETIHNAWCAIPLFWFNQMDGRGPWDLQGSIKEHQEVMRWYGERKVPVELNEPHHWGMRDAPDVVFVVSGFLAAYNAKMFGVKDYIAQFMFNSPPNLSIGMDLAKMLAILNMILPLQNDHFRIWKQTRTGLLSYPLDESEAIGHLSSTIFSQMALEPDIVHVVGHTEADHAATPADVITSCKAAARTIRNARESAPALLLDPQVQEQTEYLVQQAKITLSAISQLEDDPTRDAWTDPVVLSKAVSLGIMDAPQLRNNAFAPGKVITRIIHGASLAVGQDGSPLDEQTRMERILNQGAIR